jgi:hypothetical protein
MGVDRNANGVLDGDETPPLLTALRSGTSLTISWPTNSVAVVLEFTDSLSPPNWKTETSVQSVNSGRLMVAVSSTEPYRFYRLRGL